MNNMVDNKQNAKNLSVIAAVLILLNTLFSLTPFGFTKFLSLVVGVVFAVGLFMGKKNMQKGGILLVIGAGGTTLLSLINLIDYITLTNFLWFLGYAALTVLVLDAVLPQIKLGQYIPGEFKKYIHFIPAGIMLIACVFALLTAVIRWAGMDMGYILGKSFFAHYFKTFFVGILEAAGALLASMWLVSDTEEEEEQPYQAQQNGTTYVSSAPKAQTPGIEEGYYDLALHVILLFVTCGIWQYIWIYKTTSYLNNCPGEERRDPVTKLLLCMFIPFYSIYWTYKSAMRIDKMAAMRGVPGEIATICLIVSFFVPVVAPILMQSKINAVAQGAPKAAASTTADNVVYAAPAPKPEPAPAPTVDTAEEIRKYKELLDSGAITQEEYDAKKKQLLDM